MRTSRTSRHSRDYSTHSLTFTGIRPFQRESHDALAHFYDAWMILLRAEGKWLPQGTLTSPTWTLFVSFLHAVLAAPLGSRPRDASVCAMAIHRSDFVQTRDVQRDEEDEEEGDDSRRFADLLSAIGAFARHDLSQFLPLILQSVRVHFFPYILLIVESSRNDSIISMTSSSHPRCTPWTRSPSTTGSRTCTGCCCSSVRVSSCIDCDLAFPCRLHADVGGRRRVLSRASRDARGQRGRGGGEGGEVRRGRYQLSRSRRGSRRDRHRPDDTVRTFLASGILAV